MEIDRFVNRLMEMFPLIMRDMTSHETHDLATGKITLPQFRAIQYLADCDPCKMSGLAGYLRITPAAATGLIDRLIAQGLVTRRQDADDRRIVWIGLTAKGKTTVNSISKQRKEGLKGIFGKLSAAERAQYLSLMEKIITIAK